MDPSQAAILLQRNDDNVDFQRAWQVLRDMTRDKDYRNKVLAHIAVPREVEELVLA